MIPLQYRIQQVIPLIAPVAVAEKKNAILVKTFCGKCSFNIKQPAEERMDMQTVLLKLDLIILSIFGSLKSSLFHCQSEVLTCVKKLILIHVTLLIHFFCVDAISEQKDV
ncbi:hypothetical protein BpHYR1_046603 [Brachionus plicatilis]|uniref:Uncharacterized protein n=1 Tax=Brachionus plicatilis TaxID=10195 RepID=A0A3M7S3G2_BRAPC|nr:hypothetical protein BpHYR1_046603 [Brachionus plicatilis]